MRATETLEFVADPARDPDGTCVRDLIAAHIACTRWHAWRGWATVGALAAAGCETAAGLARMPWVQLVLLKITGIALLATAGIWRQEAIRRRERDDRLRQLGGSLHISVGRAVERPR